jgi:putative Mg2+ transporter-C (MgtC) family protein
MALERGYEIAGGTLAIGASEGVQEWRFVALALSRKSGAPLAALAAELAKYEGIDSFQLSHARN